MSLFDTVTAVSGSDAGAIGATGTISEEDLYLFSIQKDMIVQASSYINKNKKNKWRILVKKSFNRKEKLKRLNKIQLKKKERRKRKNYQLRKR